MRRLLPRAVLTCGALASVLIVTGRAAAVNGEPCNAFTDEDNAVPTLYIENGDTQEPLLKKIGKLLMQSGTKLRIVYRNRPTCNLRNSLFTNATMQTVVDGTAARPVRYIPASIAFDPSGAAPTCTVPDAPTPGQPIVLGIGATYLSSCAATPAQPADVKVFNGPVQAYGFITHKNSSQIAITAEEGYLAYGFTEGAGEAAPWAVQNLRFKRGTRRARRSSAPSVSSRTSRRGASSSLSDGTTARTSISTSSFLLASRSSSATRPSTSARR